MARPFEAADAGPIRHASNRGFCGLPRHHEMGSAKKCRPSHPVVGRDDIAAVLAPGAEMSDERNGSISTIRAGHDRTEATCSASAARGWCWRSLAPSAPSCDAKRRKLTFRAELHRRLERGCREGALLSRPVVTSTALPEGAFSGGEFRTVEATAREGHGGLGPGDGVSRQRHHVAPVETVSRSCGGVWTGERVCGHQHAAALLSAIGAPPPTRSAASWPPFFRLPLRTRPMRSTTDTTPAAASALVRETRPSGARSPPSRRSSLGHLGARLDARRGRAPSRRVGCA